MDGNINNNQTISELTGKIEAVPRVDKTLSKEGCAADAKEVGERLRNIDPHFADNVQYDNTNSKLAAVNTQTAIDEISGKVNTANENIEKANEAIGKTSDDLKKYMPLNNKPTGSYTGNGSSATRTIQINGTGGCLVVFSGSYMIGFITQNGAVFFATGDSSVKCFPVAQAKFMSGTLTLASADNFLNGNGNTYHYQVL